MRKLNGKPIVLPEPELSNPIPTEEIAYCRVSEGRDQDPDFQVALMLKRGIPKENIFVEAVSGKSVLTRPKLKQALMMMEGRIGWTLVVWKLDRLGRDTIELLQMMERFRENQWNLVSLTEMIDTHTPFGRFWFKNMAAMAQYEVEQTSERTKAGMLRRKELGVVTGRRSEITVRQFKKMERLLLEKPQMSVREIGEQFKVSPSTVNHHFPGWRSKTKQERKEWRAEHPLPAWKY